MNKIKRKDFSNYLAEAKSWETDKVIQLKSSLRKAWIAAILASIVAVVSVITVAILGPQKTVVPYLVRVDNSTGNMEVVSNLKDSLSSYGEVINKFNLQWYVRWRESYSIHTVTDYYNNVGYMSGPKEQQKYGKLMAKSNPKSPLNKFRGNEVVVTIKSITFIKEGVALVRFVKEMQSQNSLRAQHWLATITFMYVNAPQTEKVRAINPLGFQVLEYRLDLDQTVGEMPLVSRSSFANPRESNRSQLLPREPATPPMSAPTPEPTPALAP